MAGEDLIELKFRLGDGTDIGPSKYSPKNVPKSINDVELINAGKILENKTLAEFRLSIVELPGGIITMHIVVRPPFSDKNSGNLYIRIFL
ncbi:hypothetical protein CsSME_00035376 [Camellia sinensis var. sinensis]